MAESSFTSSIVELFWSNSRPTMLFWVLMIFTLSLIVYLVVAAVYGSRAPNDLAPTPVQLSTTAQLLDSGATNNLMTNPGFTIAGFFNVTMGDRTTNMQDPNVANYTTLIGIPGTVEFQLAPAGISMNDYSARLRVTTAEGDEYVELPPMPQQKWIFLCILRDGRRFDVMYNDQIVGSHRLDRYPNTSTTNPLQIAPSSKKGAASRFLGKAVHIFTMNYRMSPSDLAVLRAQLSDTTGAPPEPMPFPLPSIFSFPDFRTFCIPGLPCSNVTQPPPNQMQMWTTIYN